MRRMGGSERFYGDKKNCAYFDVVSIYLILLRLMNVDSVLSQRSFFDFKLVYY